MHVMVGDLLAAVAPAVRLIYAPNLQQNPSAPRTTHFMLRDEPRERLVQRHSVETEHNTNREFVE